MTMINAQLAPINSRNVANNKIKITKSIERQYYNKAFAHMSNNVRPKTQSTLSRIVEQR